MEKLKPMQWLQALGGRPYQEFVADYPDYALLFAWNHAKEIMGKEQRFQESGGKWIVFVPSVQVLD